jgi:hypothetical protein
MVDNDKPGLVKAILKGYLMGTMSNNGRRPREPATVEGQEAQDVAGVTE